MSVAPLSSSSAAATVSGKKKASLSQVEHKTIIDGVCYDVTEFMKTHPGRTTRGTTTRGQPARRGGLVVTCG